MSDNYKYKYIECLFELPQAGEDLYREGCMVTKGLIIISKYMPYTSNVSIPCSEDDLIVSASLGDLIDSGCTDEDFKELRSLGWFIYSGFLSFNV